MSTRKDRLSAIQEIVAQHALNNQEELLLLLNRKGFSFTQATLSRDMKYLKIIKSPDVNGNYVYILPQRNNYSLTSPEIKESELASRGFISIEFSGNLAVVKTRPGYAMGIASDIDNRATHEILGTIAGDDTILLIPREGISRKEIINALSIFIPNIKF